MTAKQMNKYRKTMRDARRKLFDAMAVLPTKELLDLLCDELEATITGDIQYLGMDIREIVDKFDWENHEELKEDRRLSRLEKRKKTRYNDKDFSKLSDAIQGKK